MISLRDRREANWFWASRDIVYKDGKKLGPYGIAVYMSLCAHANDQGKAWPSLSTLAEEIGCGERKVREVLRELETLKWIKSEPKYREDGSQMSNEYSLLPSPHATPPARKDTAPLAPRADKRESVNENQKTSLGKLYEECFGFLCSAFQLETLTEFEKTYSHKYLEGALKEAAARNKRDLRYVEGILKRWQVEGMPNGNGQKQAERPAALDPYLAKKEVK